MMVMVIDELPLRLQSETTTGHKETCKDVLRQSLDIDLGIDIVVVVPVVAFPSSLFLFRRCCCQDGEHY